MFYALAHETLLVGLFTRAFFRTAVMSAVITSYLSYEEFDARLLAILTGQWKRAAVQLGANEFEDVQMDHVGA